MEVYSRTELLHYCSTETLTNFALEGFILSILTLVAFWTTPSTFTQCSERLWLFLGNLYSWSKTQPHHRMTWAWSRTDWRSSSSNQWSQYWLIISQQLRSEDAGGWTREVTEDNADLGDSAIHSNESRRWLTSTVVKFCFPLGSSPQPIICLHPTLEILYFILNFMPSSTAPTDSLSVVVKILPGISLKQTFFFLFKMTWHFFLWNGDGTSFRLSDSTVEPGGYFPYQLSRSLVITIYFITSTSSTLKKRGNWDLPSSLFPAFWLYSWETPHTPISPWHASRPRSDEVTGDGGGKLV